MWQHTIIRKGGDNVDLARWITLVCVLINTFIAVYRLAKEKLKERQEKKSLQEPNADQDIG